MSEDPNAVLATGVLRNCHDDLNAEVWEIWGSVGARGGMGAGGGMVAWWASVGMRCVTQQPTWAE